MPRCFSIYTFYVVIYSTPYLVLQCRRTTTDLFNSRSESPKKIRSWVLFKQQWVEWDITRSELKTIDLHSATEFFNREFVTPWGSKEQLHGGLGNLDRQFYLSIKIVKLHVYNCMAICLP